uniref:Protein phosphatase n=1 Tax=Timema shepardi TaxID=629360 RepID=A0A7R9B0S6_TIMSH|nr:unnamed protein product [Timema shepardi]
MVGKTKRERIVNENIRQELGVIPALKKIEAAQLIWLGHVERMEGERVAVQCWAWELEGDSPRGRPRNRWKDGVQEVLKRKGMQNIWRLRESIVWTGRLLSRALWNGLSNYSNCVDPNLNRRNESRIVSAVCGFPKELANAKLKRGQFGDDAWFTARYKSSEVIGVADGVGGWRNYGIDPGVFSNFLMRTCERLVLCGRFVPTEPAGLLARSYYELLESKQPILAVLLSVMVLNPETRTAYAANIGDSGFVLVRKGEVVHRSEEQQHYFNTPFQLSLPPPGHSGLVLSDRPESADTSNFTVEDGDVILLATDGVFDNVPDHLLLSELCKVEGERDPVKLQGVANAIALMARSLAFDSTFMSPFAKNARDNGIDTLEQCRIYTRQGEAMCSQGAEQRRGRGVHTYFKQRTQQYSCSLSTLSVMRTSSSFLGGKPDDITVLLATVVL